MQAIIKPLRTKQAILCVTGLLLWSTGCSRREAETPEEQPALDPVAREQPATPPAPAPDPEPATAPEPVIEVSSATEAKQEPAIMDEPETDEALPEQPEPTELETLPRVADTLPRLTMGVLANARLEVLPEDEWIRAGNITLGRADWLEEMDRTAWQLRELMRKYAFVVLEQKLVESLMEQEAREQLAARGRELPEASAHEVIRAFAREWELLEPVSDEDIARYYEQNLGLMGTRTLEDMADSLREHIENKRLERAIGHYARQLLEQTPVAVDMDWAMEQDANVRDNHVDLSRESGQATMAVFDLGASGANEAMQAIRQTYMQAYPGRLNVVYVNASQNRLLASRYGVLDFPHTVFFDQYGEVMESRPGVMTHEQVDAALARMGVE